MIRRLRSRFFLVSKVANGRHYLSDMVVRMRRTLAKTKHRAQILQFFSKKLILIPFFLRLEDQFVVIASILPFLLIKWVETSNISNY